MKEKIQICCRRL